MLSMRNDMTGAGRVVKVYTLYIDDDRYSAPSLDVIMAQDDKQAELLANERLASSNHYVAIAVWEDERFVTELPCAGASQEGPKSGAA